MEQLARRLPNKKQSSTLDQRSIATGEPHRYNAPRVSTAGSVGRKKGKKKDVVGADPVKKAPLPATPTSSLLVVEDPVKVKIADSSNTEKRDQVEEVENSSGMTASITPSSKRKQQKEDRVVKEKKKRKTQERSRGRSRSRGPSKLYRKKGKRSYDTSDSDSDSSSEDETESSSEIDSEEEERKRKRAKSRSRAQSRGRGRARSRSRAHYSDSDSENDSDTDSFELKPINLRFTVPNGDLLLRRFNPPISFPKLLEKAYALANINQEIPIKLSYELDGSRVRLADGEDLEAFMLVISEDPSVNIKVEKVTSIAKLKETASSSNEVASALVGKSEQAAKRSGPAKKAVEAVGAVIEGEDSSDDEPLSAIKVSQSKKQSNGKSTVSLENESNVPLARIVITDTESKEAPANQGQAGMVNNGDTMPMASTPLNSDKTEKGESKGKRKRRTPEEIERDKAIKEEEKKRKETERLAHKEEKEAERKEAERFKREEIKKAEEDKKAKEEVEIKKAKEEEEAKTKAEAEKKAKAEEEERQKKAKPEKKSKSKAMADKPDEIKNGVTDKTEASKSETTTTEPAVSTPSAADDGKKKKASRAKKTEKKVDGEARDKEVEPPAKVDKVSKISSPAKEISLDAEKAKNTPSEEEAASKKSNKAAVEDKTKKSASTAAPKNTSADQFCAICFEKNHNKLQCPIIDAGRETVEKYLSTLKEKKRRKTNLENEACKLLQGWLKMNRFDQTKEQNALLLFRQQNPKHALSKKLLEAERLEDLQEQQESYEALEREMKRMRDEKLNKSPSIKKSALPTTAAIEEVRDIIDKVNKDRGKMGLPPAHTVASSNESARESPTKVAAVTSPKVVEASSETDQLHSSSSPASSQGLQSNGRLKRFASPTNSESELANSPMLMADGEPTNQIADKGTMSGLIEVTPSLPTVLSQIKDVEDKKESSGESSSTSDDSSEGSDGKSSSVVDSNDEEDTDKSDEDTSILKNANESVSSDEDDSESEEEMDEIEATPVNSKNEGRSGWLGTFLGGSKSTQEQPTPSQMDTSAALPASFPPSAQRPLPSNIEKEIVATPSPSNRPQLAGVTRMSQLYNSKSHSPFVQKGTPQNSSAVETNGRSPAKRKADQSFDSDSEDDQSDASGSDKESKLKDTLPSAKRAGNQNKKKPRKSYLSQMQSS